ncbi:PaaX family transcriptional regulator [Alteromonas sp. BMJM2]|uniref:PaaX family transcriptional regulator n=1 Tax=Alteromonas sp. BMJM2 TaxID=2954241 RepID=UPI0022B2DA46|nr:PaaX family transcriptional regulator [Alteromonas sp. BMJM2]
MNKAETKKPVARKLLLKLLGSRDNVKMSASSAVRVGALFNISENSIRVTINRLHSAGMLSLVDRGYYLLGKEGVNFAREINSWRNAETSLLPSWNGDWIVVHTHMLAKSDKKQARQNDRALKILGLKKLLPDMHIRPSNIQGGASVVREKLQALGLSQQAAVFCAFDLEPKLHLRAGKLWNTAELEQGYQQGVIELKESINRLPTLSLEDATTESFEIGDSALHQLVFDPLLPSPLINESLRREFAELVRHYDDIGAQIWHQFLSLDNTQFA